MRRQFLNLDGYGYGYSISTLCQGTLRPSARGGLRKGALSPLSTVGDTAPPRAGLTDGFKQSCALDKTEATPLLIAGGEPVGDLYRRFMEVVIAHHREALLPFLVQSYLMRYRKAQRLMRVEMESATPLNAATRRRLIEQLTATSGNQIELHEQVNPELIGGFRLRMEGKRIDASFARQLAEIREQWLNPSHA